MQDIVIQKQVSQQYSRQQSNPDTTKELENKESKENEREVCAYFIVTCILWYYQLNFAYHIQSCL